MARTNFQYQKGFRKKACDLKNGSKEDERTQLSSSRIVELFAKFDLDVIPFIPFISGEHFSATLSGDISAFYPSALESTGPGGAKADEHIVREAEHTPQSLPRGAAGSLQDERGMVRALGPGSAPGVGNARAPVANIQQ